MASGSTGGDRSIDGATSGNNDPADKDKNSLEGFITTQLAEQNLNRGENPGENIDEEKMNRFLSRALSESKRMNKEIAKSEAKMSKLHAELGADRLTQWRQEHSAEVLSHQQCQLVDMTHKK